MMFTYPIRPWSYTKVDTVFLDPHYHTNRGAWHPGWDVNLISGGDSDLGYPLQSMVPGTVLEAYHHDVWGGLVLVRAEDWIRREVELRLGRVMPTLEVQYGHLQHITVEPGMQIDAGDHVGTIGKGAKDQWYAHLHWEIRRRSFPAAFWPGGTNEAAETVQNDYLNPETMMAEFKWSDWNTLPSVHRIEMRPRLIDIDGVQMEPKQLLAFRRVTDKVYIRPLE